MNSREEIQSIIRSFWASVAPVVYVDDTIFGEVAFQIHDDDWIRFFINYKIYRNDLYKNPKVFKWLGHPISCIVELRLKNGEWKINKKESWLSTIKEIEQLPYENLPYGYTSLPEAKKCWDGIIKWFQENQDILIRRCLHSYYHHLLQQMNDHISQLIKCTTEISRKQTELEIKDNRLSFGDVVFDFSPVVK
jgi:hypothetical protein